jgi:hypothetical protein
MPDSVGKPMTWNVQRYPSGVAPAMMVLLTILANPTWSQTVEDGSQASIGPGDTKVVLDLIRRELDSPEAKVTNLRRSGPVHICGSVNVKNPDGIYTGERGFVVDLQAVKFGRVPDGPELLDPRVAGFALKEAVRQDYFRLCVES